MKQELTLLLKQRSVIYLLCISMLVTGLSLSNGWKNISHMRAQITHAQQEATQQRALQLLELAKHDSIDAGEVGYYFYHQVYRHPSDWSFIALGNRTVTPYIQRVRMLGLQGQLYDGESHHPEYVMLGAFDYTFWLVFFLPLITIALMHDLKASEFQAQRLSLLQSLISQPILFWAKRVILRWALVFITFIVPVLIAWLTLSLPWQGFVQVVQVTSLYSLFWVVLCALVSLHKHALNANTNAMLLASLWLIICIVFPNLSQLWLHQRYPVPEGSQIALWHRQLVHNAWDLPKKDALNAFYQLYPQWQDTPPVTERFHWKWYFAFQHMADVKLADYVAERETSLRQREQVTAQLSYFLPSVRVQQQLETVSQSNVTHLMEHRARIHDFHSALRHTLYPYLFEERAMSIDALSELPTFK